LTMVRAECMLSGYVGEFQPASILVSLIYLSILGRGWCAPVDMETASKACNPPPGLTTPAEGERLRLGAPCTVRRPSRSLWRGVLTEIYLCNGCC
jgi:hypothetical protein